VADTYDVLTLVEGRAALKKHTTALDETTLASWITGASRRLDRLVGPIVRRSVVEDLDGYGDTTLYLTYHPNTAITSVVEWSGTTSTALVEETRGNLVDGFLPQPWEFDPTFLGNELHRRIGGIDAGWARGRRNVVVTYSAGRYADTASVDPLFKRSCGLMLVNAWRSLESTVVEQGEYDIPISSFPTFAVPRAVRELCAGQIQDPLPL
jgi:hypothetical protein